jgi:hypothetical protein
MLVLDVELWCHLRAEKIVTEMIEKRIKVFLLSFY